MAIPWLTVLQNVPWSDVIGNAPKVADGARKLWNTVTKKESPPAAAHAEGQLAPSREAQAMAALDARAAALETAVADLHGQMLASSELIKALADQNAQLIARIESNRVRLLWLSAALLLVGVIAIAALGLAWRLQHV
jgi:hypothetical protein